MGHVACKFETSLPEGRVTNLPPSCMTAASKFWSHVSSAAAELKHARPTIQFRAYSALERQGCKPQLHNPSLQDRLHTWLYAASLPQMRHQVSPARAGRRTALRVRTGSLASACRGGCTLPRNIGSIHEKGALPARAARRTALRMRTGSRARACRGGCTLRSMRVSQSAMPPV